MVILLVLFGVPSTPEEVLLIRIFDSKKERQLNRTKDHGPPMKSTIELRRDALVFWEVTSSRIFATRKECSVRARVPSHRRDDTCRLKSVNIGNDWAMWVDVNKSPFSVVLQQDF